MVQAQVSTGLREEASLRFYPNEEVLIPKDASPGKNLADKAVRHDISDWVEPLCGKNCMGSVPAL